VSGGTFTFDGTNPFATIASTQAADVATINSTYLGSLVGTITLGASTSSAGTYPTTASTQAAQQATDSGIVNGLKGGITTATTITFGSNSVTGTLNMALYGLLSNYSDPGVANVLSSVSYSYGGTNNRNGTYVAPTTSEVAAGVPFGPGGSYTGVAVLTESEVATAIAGIGSNLSTLLTGVNVAQWGGTNVGGMPNSATPPGLSEIEGVISTPQQISAQVNSDFFRNSNVFLVMAGL
jgi:hypothetical protein